MQQTGSRSFVATVSLLQEAHKSTALSGPKLWRELLARARPRARLSRGRGIMHLQPQGPGDTCVLDLFPPAHLL